MKIFISYAREDESFVLQLVTSLTNAGYETWLDTKDIPAGTKWSTSVEQGLRDCQLLIVVITHKSMKSPNVENEWQYFFDKKKPFIPLLLRDAETSFELSRINYLDFRDESTYEIKLAELYKRLSEEAQKLDVAFSPFGETKQTLSGEEALTENNLPEIESDKYLSTIKNIKDIISNRNSAISEISVMLDDNGLLGEVREILLLLILILESTKQQVYEELLLIRCRNYGEFQIELEKLETLVELYFRFESLPDEYKEEYIGKIQSIMFVKKCEIYMNNNEQEEAKILFSQALTVIKTPDDVRQEGLNHVKEILLSNYSSRKLFEFWEAEFDLLSGPNDSFTRREFVDELFAELDDSDFQVSRSIFKRQVDISGQDVSKKYENLVNELCGRTVDLYIGQRDYEVLRRLRALMLEISQSIEADETFDRLYGRVSRTIDEYESLQ